MVNIVIECPEGMDPYFLRDSVCNALAGNRGFIESDIVVCDPTVPELTGVKQYKLPNPNLHISLGDDADKNPLECNLVVQLMSIETPQHN
jgi:hypothetical protein